MPTETETETKNPYRKKIRVRQNKRKCKSRVWKTRWVTTDGPTKTKKKK